MRLGYLCVALSHGLLSVLMACEISYAMTQVPFLQTGYDDPRSSLAPTVGTASAMPALPISECPAAVSRPVLRVAIIGAGPAGTSAAYYLSQARQQLQEARRSSRGPCANASYPHDLVYTVYERSERVGGRVLSVHPLDDPSITPVEMGANVFLDTNGHLMGAADTLHLSLQPRESMPHSDYGLWNGRDFLLENLENSRWDQLREYLRYGSSPQSLQTMYELLLMTVCRNSQRNSRRCTAPHFFIREPMSQPRRLLRDIHGWLSGTWSTVSAWTILSRKWRALISWTIKSPPPLWMKL